MGEVSPSMSPSQLELPIRRALSLSGVPSKQPIRGLDKIGYSSLTHSHQAEL